MMQRAITLADETATHALGHCLEVTRPGVGCVFLHGDLGAGKTTLVRSLLMAAGHQGPVRSPTYTLVEPYQLGQRRVFHLDLYRLTDPEELEFIGLRELIDAGLLLIEWPEQGAGVLPEPSLSIALAGEGNRREASIAWDEKQWPRLATMLESFS